MPHISVMIPAYNSAHLIGRTIQSVLTQDFQDWDVLVVDDASVDGTVAEVDRFCARDPRIRLAVNPQNLGLTHNWNRCLSEAQGPLVEVLQSDDMIDADYLGLVSEYFETHPQTGFVAASCRYVDPEDRIIHSGHPRPAQHYRAGDEAVTALLTGGFPHVSSIVIRRECYERVGGYDERIWQGPDMEMDARLASHFDFYHFGDVHTSFRRHGTNMGQLEYLRDDFLDADAFKRTLTWGYCSPDGLRALGVVDLVQYVRRQVAQSALGGVIIATAYGRSALARRYFSEALRLSPRVCLSGQFWKAASLVMLPWLGRRYLQKRMSIQQGDSANIQAVEASLAALKKKASP
jgi:glycosyltransferase involved in cell wall biosynthesis